MIFINVHRDTNETKHWMTVKQINDWREKNIDCKKREREWNKDENCSSFKFDLVFVRDKKKWNKNKWNTHVHCSSDQKRGPLNTIEGKPLGGPINGKPPIGARKNFSYMKSKEKR